MIYILKITNSQDETITLYLDNLEKIIPIINCFEEVGCPCLFKVYNDEFEEIKKSHGVEL